MPCQTGFPLINRRKLLLLSVLGSVSIAPRVVQGNSSLPIPAKPAPEDNRDETERTQEDWFDEFLSSKPSVGALHVFRFADEMYAITKPISWTPTKGENEDTFTPITVPAGFVTDFASVPRIFWQFLPRDGRYTYPAIVHDYLYWLQDRPRETADEIFRLGMKEFRLDPVTINAVYWGVRAGGSLAWRKNAKAKTQGERRILKYLPDNPLITWSSWRNKSEVFEP